MRPDKTRPTFSLFFPAAEASHEAGWHPPADVYRTRAGGWLVKLDLAGVRPEDVEVRVSGDRLTVRGSRRDWSLQEGYCHYQMEISYSHFERSLILPCDLDHARVSAEHRHGMLLIEVQPEGAK